MIKNFGVFYAPQCIFLISFHKVFSRIFENRVLFLRFSQVWSFPKFDWSFFVNWSPNLTFIHAFISCQLDYCNALLYGIADCQLQRLQSVQNAAARLVTGLRRTEHIMPILKSLHWLPVRQRVTYKLATLVHKCVNGRAPEYLAEFCHPSVYRRPGMRSADSGKLHVPHTQTSFGDRSFAVAGPRTWCHLRFVSVILHIHKTVKILFVCLTVAANVTFNWRLTNVLIN